VNKKAIIDYLAKNAKYTEEHKELIKAIEEAREEMESASQYFETVSAPPLVDYAIHLEDAARTKFMYLLNEAKLAGVKGDTNIYLREVEL
jgi:hypothetical protein